MSASRTRIRASSRRSSGQLAATASGAMRPTATSARRTPSSSMTSGASRPPAATPSVRIASKPANMRARTVSSASRASSVKPPTSISALPMPTRPSRTIAAACSGTTPIRASGAPNSAMPTPNQLASPPRRTSPNAKIEPSTPPAPTAAFRTPTPGSPVSRRSIATTTANTVRQPRVNVCTSPSAVISREPAIGRDRGEALEHLAAATAGGLRSRRRVVRERDDDQAGQQRRSGARGEDRGRSARRKQDGRDQRAAERGERVQHAANRIRARQLLRRLRQRGQQRRVRRSVQRHGDRGDDGEAIRRRRRAAGGRHHRSTSQHRGADDADADQDPLATNPVGHRREERCEQRRGSHAGGRDGADRGNATVAERHDTERDHERALARPHRSERDLGAAQRPAVRHLAERARPIAEPRRETSHHDATIAKAPPPPRSERGLTARERGASARQRRRARRRPAR